MASAETILFEVEVQTDDTASQQLGEMDESVDSLEQSFQDLQRRSELTAEDLQNATVTSAQQASQSMTQLGSSASSAATNLSFELVRASQDAGHSIGAVVNQIPQMAEQFTQLRSQTGSTRGALSALVSTMTGPTGLLAAGTLLVQFGPKLISFFTDTGEAAQNTEEKVNKVSEAVSSILDVQAGQTEKLELGLEGAEQAIGETETNIQALETILERLPESGTGLVERFDELGPVAKELVQSLTEQSEGLTLSRDLVRQRLNDEKAIRKDLKKQKNQLQQQLRLRRRFKELGAQSGETKLPETPEAPDVLDATDEEQKITLDTKIEPPDEEELDAFDQVLGDVQDRISTINSRPFLSGAAKAEKRVQAIATRIRQAQRAGAEFSRQEINDLIRGLDLAEDEAEQVREALRGSGEEARQAQEQANQKLARGINLAFRLGKELARAFQKGDVEAQQLLGTVLQIVGQAVAISNPAAGAALGGIGGIISSFDEGGYTGSGAPDQVAGVVHRGEFVMPAPVVEELGVGTLRGLQAMVEGQMHVSGQDLRRVAGVPGFQGGGLVQPVTQHSPSASRPDVEAVAQQAADRASRQTAERVADSIADRPVIIKVPPRGARDIVETGQELQARESPRET